MRKLFSAFSIWIILQSVFSQNITVTDDNSYSAENSAILDVKSTSKDFLPPRMTNSEINNILNPATGLIVYSTDLNKPIYFNGSNWHTFSEVEVIFEDSSTVTDIDGNIYKTVAIGNQVWLAENLKTTRYSNGDLIGTTTSNQTSLWDQDTSKYQWSYEGNENNVPAYGRLYTWYVITDSRNVCPTGWHVPTNREWYTLEEFVDPRSLQRVGVQYETDVGSKLKETGYVHWKTPNIGATDEFGFKAIPSGFRNTRGGFNSLNYMAVFWSSGDLSVRINCSSSHVVKSHNLDKKRGCSVRCVKD